MLHDPKHDLNQVSLNLLAAAELLEKGWIQHVYDTGELDTGRRYCATGAMMRVIGQTAGSSWRCREHLHAACNRIASCLPDAYQSDMPFFAVEKYNDAKGRTQGEMVDLLRAAAWRGRP